VPRFDVTIAGELNMDLILYGLPEVLPRERELLADRMMLTLGSSSAIVAHNLASLGSKVGFISCVGRDQMGEDALTRLSASGVDISCVNKLDTEQTGLSVILQGGDSRTILTYPGTIFSLTLKHLDLGYLSASRHFHLSSFYLQRGVQPDIPELFRKLKNAGLTISMDSNDDPDDKWGGGIHDALSYVDIFLPNEREAKRTDDLHRALETLSDLVPLVVIKRGSQGAIARRRKESFSAPAIKLDAVDAVGAGDSFDAGFLHEFVRGADLPRCLELGNLAGALSTTRPGGTEAFRDSVHRKQFMQQHGEHS
jgi:sugar/nucleoside kinase (ribokinase family)